MRDKLALILAMAGFALVTAFGVGMAGAEPSPGVGSAQPLDAGAALSPVADALACANQIDDDEDGLTDLDDPDCESAEGASEEPTASQGPGVGAPESGTAPRQPAPGKPVVGVTLRAADAPGAQRQRNGGNGNGGDGGVSAPAATAGDQLPDPGPDGGSRFDDGGAPSDADPSVTIAPFGPAPIGVPNVIIDSFEIPPFLLPIYQACGTEYGIPWQILASINKIETGFGTNLNVSSAGALGWMQFMPASWEAYGVDANGDKRKDPYNPVDAICAAANYLKAAGAHEDLYKAIFAYNHADWYVQEVLLYARAYGKLPTDLVGSLTGLTEGARFPVAASSRYADDISARAGLEQAGDEERDDFGAGAEVISSSPTRRGINIFAAEGSPVVAVNDGVIVKIGSNERLGRFVVLRDAYGNRFTYAQLGELIRDRRLIVMPSGKEKRIPVDSQNIRPRLHALPDRIEGDDEGSDAGTAMAVVPGADGSLEVGSKVIAGTVLGRIGGNDQGIHPYVHFAIQPAGRGAPKIDPKPILDGWKLLEATAIYRAKGKNPFAMRLSGAGVLLLSKEALLRRVLADRRIEVSDCDRVEIRGGQIDRRVLATMAFLSNQGFRLTITSMLCGRHGSITTSGYISNHSYGNAIDIAAVNGIPILGNQGPGSITEMVLREVLRLQGTLRPDELISLHDLGGPSFAMADHADHIHIGWSPLPGFGENGEPRFVQLLKPDQWRRLTERLDEIENPDVLTEPSQFSLPAEPRKGAAGAGG